jgi:hypothetical protein
MLVKVSCGYSTGMEGTYHDHGNVATSIREHAGGERMAINTESCWRETVINL